MLTIYGSPLCPDCRECKANLDAHGAASPGVTPDGIMAKTGL